MSHSKITIDIPYSYLPSNYFFFQNLQNSTILLNLCVNINAFTSILSLIIGALVWGIAGMILFLPFAAMLKIVCEQYEELKPVALLIGSQNYQENDGGNKFVNKCGVKIKNWSSKFHSSSKKSKKRNTQADK